MIAQDGQQATIRRHITDRARKQSPKAVDVKVKIFETISLKYGAKSINTVFSVICNKK